MTLQVFKGLKICPMLYPYWNSAQARTLPNSERNFMEKTYDEVIAERHEAGYAIMAEETGRIRRKCFWWGCGLLSAAVAFGLGCWKLHVMPQPLGFSGLWVLGTTALGTLALLAATAAFCCLVEALTWEADFPEYVMD